LSTSEMLCRFQQKRHKHHRMSEILHTTDCWYLPDSPHGTVRRFL